MELDIWLSMTATSVKQNPEPDRWDVTVKREDGTERTFHVDHVVIALGLGGGKPNIPDIPGRDKFKGEVLRSTQHSNAKDHIGKKVVVIGACTSGEFRLALIDAKLSHVAHDISADYVEHGVDVTLFQHSSTYVMSAKEGMPILMGRNSPISPVIMPTDFISS